MGIFKEKILPAIRHPVKTFMTARSLARIAAMVDRSFEKEIAKQPIGMEFPSATNPFGLNTNDVSLLSHRALQIEGRM